MRLRGAGAGVTAATALLAAVLTASFVPGVNAAAAPPAQPAQTGITIPAIVSGQVETTGV